MITATEYHVCHTEAIIWQQQKIMRSKIMPCVAIRNVGEFKQVLIEYHG